MQLLISVRSAAEVVSALSGGADIIDAKEPDRGSLGPVSAPTLAEIAGCLPSHRALSVALGDVTSEADVVTAMASSTLPARQAPTFLKLGFAGVVTSELVCRLLTTAVRLAARQLPVPRIIAVAYADAAAAGAISPDLVAESAHRAGAAGVLIDTHLKEGAGLLDWISPSKLAVWVSEARRAGLLSAVAGGLGLEHLDRIRPAGPDVLGFRGAACDGGRGGRVSAERVQRLKRELEGGGGRAGGVSAYAGAGLRRTRDNGAISAGLSGSKSLKLND